MNYTTDIFKLFDKDWALLCAGNIDKFNMMTISWGNLGTLWGKPVCTVYVRKSRYTHDFMEANEYFTVNFMSGWEKDAMRLLGRESGRDIDKMHTKGITPMQRRGSVMFAQTNVVLVCKKLYRATIEESSIPEDVRKTYYDGQTEHDMYIGEVVEMLYKDESLYNSSLVFKSGCGTASNSSLWTVCHDRQSGLYTAEVGFGGAGGSAYDLYEITAEIFDAVGTFAHDEYESERLIKTGRHLYGSVNDKYSPPYDIVHDKNYKKLVPWARICRE